MQQTLEVLSRMWSVASTPAIIGRQGLAEELLDASTQSLISPGLCLPLGGGLQLIFTQPLALKPKVFFSSWTKRDRLWWVTLRIDSLSSLASQKFQVSESESSESHIRVHAEYVCVRESLTPSEPELPPLSAAWPP